MILALILLISCSVNDAADCFDECVLSCERILIKEMGNSSKVCDVCGDAPSVESKTEQCYQWIQEEVFSPNGILYSECYCTLGYQQYPFNERCDDVILHYEGDACLLEEICYN